MKPKSILLALLILIALLGAFIAYHAMVWGPWAYNDSSAYVSAARNFASGGGLDIIHSTGKISQVTEFPPLFSVLIGLFGGNNLDYISTLRWWDTIIFFGSILVFSLVIFYSTKRVSIALLSPIVFLSSPQILRTYTSAMSEPLFIFLVLLSLLLFVLLLSKGKLIYKIAFFVISCLIPLTRYAGLLFIGIFGIGIFLNSQNKTLSKKIFDVVIYYLFSYTPVVIWGISLYHKYGKFGGKSFSLGLSNIQLMFSSLIEEFNVVKLWIPYTDLYQGTFIGNLIIFIFSIIVIFLLGLTSYRFILGIGIKNKSDKSLFFICLLLILGYVLFIGFTHSITTPQIDIIDRMMVPIYPLVLIILLISIDGINLRKWDRVFTPILLTLIILIPLRYNALRTYTYTKSLSANGEGFTARQYQESGIIDELIIISGKKVMMSSSAGFVLFHTNVYPLQIENFPNHSYGSGTSYGEELFKEQEGALIILYSDFANYYGAKSDDLLKTITSTLNNQYQDAEGGIYTYE